MDSPARDSRPAAEERLSRVRNALLELHKALVDCERVRYEKVVGAIQSPNHFLRLLTGDPWFAWLHPISRLIVAMDEMLDEEEPSRASLHILIDQAIRLLVASESGGGFAQHYFDALQEDPDVVLAHAEVMKVAGRKPSREASSGDVKPE